jgi:hypothetical protein
MCALRGDDANLRSGIQKRFSRLRHFHLLESVLDEDGNFDSLEIIHGRSPGFVSGSFMLLALLHTGLRRGSQRQPSSSACGV